MSGALSCAESSLAAAEPLAATATEASRWLLVEMRGAWGRDALADTALPPGVRATLERFPGKVVFVRRPDRRSGATVISATVNENGGTALRQELEALDDLSAADLEGGEPVEGSIFLVCAHGRRDACCARLGPPLFDLLRRRLPPYRLWQSSHLGGHRFAPNVVVLPSGVQLGRIPVRRAPEVVELIESGRIPLDLYRGRTLYAPPMQAAEILVRSVTGCVGIGELRLISEQGDRVTFSTPAGELTARAERRPGPLVPASCRAAPEPSAVWVASLESAA